LALKPNNRGNATWIAPMSQPDRIEPPSLAAFHFISLVFDERFHYLKGIAHLQGETPFSFGDIEFRDKHFDQANQVKPEQLAPFQAMSDETASALFSILGVIVYEDLISTKADLLNAALREWDDPQDEYSTQDCTLDQLQVFMLLHAKQDMRPHWIELAEFYNALPQDQQQAVSQFFTHCLNRPLDQLLSVPGPSLELPAAITEDLEVTEQDGKRYGLCPIDQHWFRDADLNEKFTIIGKSFTPLSQTPSVQRYLLIATASTLKEALASATLYTQNIESNDCIREIELRYMNEVLAIAKVDSKRMWSMPFPHIEQPAKLIWDLDGAGAGTDKISNKHFIDTLFKTEKLLGLQWSKVQKLEDDLGL
jgi:hypothetical protein